MQTYQATQLDINFLIEFGGSWENKATQMQHQVIQTHTMTLIFILSINWSIPRFVLDLTHSSIENNKEFMLGPNTKQHN